MLGNGSGPKHVTLFTQFKAVNIKLQFHASNDMKSKRSTHLLTSSIVCSYTVDTVDLFLFCLIDGRSLSSEIVFHLSIDTGSHSMFL